MKLNAKKCLIGVQELRYLGHILSAHGIAMEADKIRAIVDYPRPKNVAELRSFIGLVGHYRRFIRNFAAIASPMNSLTSTKCSWNWSDDVEKAFQTVKNMIVQAPILAQPNFEAALSGTFPFIVTTDASKEGVGGVLSQQGSDRVERPLAFYSKSLLAGQRNFAVTDLEALAVQSSVLNWKHLLYGAKIEIRTDHLPLVTLLKRMNVKPRVLRWIQDLMPFDITFRYVKGKDNCVADSACLIVSIRGVYGR